MSDYPSRLEQDRIWRDCAGDYSGVPYTGQVVPTYLGGC